MTPERALVVSCAGSGEVALIGIDPDDRLQVRASVAPGGTLMPIARHPHRDWLYVARRSDPLAVVRLEVAADRQTLRILDQAPLPASMPYLAIDDSGRWLFAASYASHLIAILPIDDDGCVGAVHRILSTGQNAHAVVPVANSRRLLVPCLGSDAVLAFGFEPARGDVVPLGAAWQARPGSGPRHLRLNARGDTVYLLNELDASIDVLAFEPERGALTHVQAVTLPVDPAQGAPWAADLHLTPDERFLFASERRSSMLHCLAVEDNGRRLRWVRATPTETQPRGFALSEDGRHLYAVGERSGGLSAYGVGEDGTLTLIQRIVVGDGPNWVVPL